MNIFKKIKQWIIEDESKDYEEILNIMKSKLDVLKQEYQKLLDYKIRFEEQPKSILDIKFDKKEKYIEEMQNIKYKDIDIFKEYELIAMKYNILIELFKKIKSVIFIESNVDIKFKQDNFNQTIAIISHLCNNLHKLEIIKNTLNIQEYISFVDDEYIEVIEISAFQEINHFEILLNMIINNNYSDKKIRISEESLNSLPNQMKKILNSKNILQ